MTGPDYVVINHPRTLSSSFRDPAGFMFEQDGELYRQINASHQEDYDRLMASGLYESLTAAGLLVPHEEVNDIPLHGDGVKIIRPERVAYVSYPHEWCFSQLKDAALCTIRAQQMALRHGMCLKDASAYNVQFHHGRAVLIDTLSFEPYREGEPWRAYRQYCQHFLAPLALMAYRDARLGQLFRIHLDGPPLDLCSKLLPGRTWLRYSLLSHIHLHARTQARYADAAALEGSKAPRPRRIGRLGFQALMASLEQAVARLRWNPPRTEWGDYYTATNYDDRAIRHKETLVEQFVGMLPAAPPLIQDLGANDGHFSRIAAGSGALVLSHDVDPVAVEKNYRHVRGEGIGNVLPLLLDLTNPGAAFGWHLKERMSLLQRTSNDAAVMALALVHHLAISNNVPLANIAAFMADMGKWLIIEFVPKEDSQVRRLLATREDIFPDYHTEGFEKAFAGHFTIRAREPVEGSHRTLYLMERR